MVWTDPAEPGAKLVSDINKRAAAWWADRMLIDEKRDEFRDALEKVLECVDWRSLHNDYDADMELQAALEIACVDMPKYFFTTSGIFPEKTGLKLIGGRLYGKDGYGAHYLDIETGELVSASREDQDEEEEMRKTYLQWRTEFNRCLLSPDMPIITAKEIDPDDLLKKMYESGFRPLYVARVFNKRFALAMAEAASEAVGGEDQMLPNE